MAALKKGPGNKAHHEVFALSRKGEFHSYHEQIPHVSMFVFAFPSID